MPPLDLIRQILKEQCECSVLVTPESRLIEDLHLESVGMLTLITELENHYQAVLEIENLSGFRTVGDIVLALEQFSQGSHV